MQFHYQELLGRAGNQNGKKRMMGTGFRHR